MNDRQEITWAPRVNLNEIRALYMSCAGGIYDELRIDNVGIALYLRCESIMEYTWANEGRVKCKRCAKDGVESFIPRKSEKPRELLLCPVCNWQIQWRVYLSETNKRSSGQLMAGHARRAFERFYHDFPLCKEANEKMLAIDRLIHEFHWMLKGDSQKPVAMRTACVNLLEGTATQIMETLDGLTYGEDTDAQMRKTRSWWSAQEPIARKAKDIPDEKAVDQSFE